MDLTEKQVEVLVCEILRMSPKQAAIECRVTASAISRRWLRLRKQAKTKNRAETVRVFFDGGLSLPPAAMQKIRHKLESLESQRDGSPRPPESR